MKNSLVLGAFLAFCSLGFADAKDDIRPVIGGRISVDRIPSLYQTRRVPTGRTIDGPGRDFTYGTTAGTISLPTVATYREYQDVKVQLSEHEVCATLGRNHGFSYDGDGWYWLSFYIGDQGPYDLAYRLDREDSRWFVESLMSCARRGGGSWFINVDRLRRHSTGTHWYIVKKSEN